MKTTFPTAENRSPLACPGFESIPGVGVDSGHISDSRHVFDTADITKTVSGRRPSRWLMTLTVCVVLICAMYAVFSDHFIFQESQRWLVRLTVVDSARPVATTRSTRPEPDSLPAFEEQTGSDSPLCNIPSLDLATVTTAILVETPPSDFPTTPGSFSLIEHSTPPSDFAPTGRPVRIPFEPSSETAVHCDFSGSPHLADPTESLVAADSAVYRIGSTMPTSDGAVIPTGFTADFPPYSASKPETLVSGTYSAPEMETGEESEGVRPVTLPELPKWDDVEQPFVPQEHTPLRLNERPSEFLAGRTLPPDLTGDTADTDLDLRVILLEDGRFFRGYVTEEATRYLVQELSGSEIVLPKKRVATVCRTLREAYEWQKRHELPGIGESIRLAGWCIQQRLWSAAGEELLMAESLSPNHPQLPQLCRQLQDALRKSGDMGDTTIAASGSSAESGISVVSATVSNPLPSASTIPTTAAAISGPRHPDADDLLAMKSRIPPECMTQFVRDIQPMLVSTCTTSGCHLRTGGDGFALMKPGQDGTYTPRTTERNMYAAIQWVDRDTPMSSPLLVAATTAHGNQKSASFSPRTADSLRRLAEWCTRVSSAPPSSLPTSGSGNGRGTAFAGRATDRNTDNGNINPDSFTVAGNLLRGQEVGRTAVSSPNDWREGTTMEVSGIDSRESLRQIFQRPSRTPLGTGVDIGVVRPQTIDQRDSTMRDTAWEKSASQIESGISTFPAAPGGGVRPASAAFRENSEPGKIVTAIPASRSAQIDVIHSASTAIPTSSASPAASRSKDPFDPAIFNATVGARPVPGFGTSGPPDSMNGMETTIASPASDESDAPDGLVWFPPFSPQSQP